MNSVTKLIIGLLILLGLVLFLANTISIFQPTSENKLTGAPPLPPPTSTLDNELDTILDEDTYDDINTFLTEESTTTSPTGGIFSTTPQPTQGPQDLNTTLDDFDAAYDEFIDYAGEE